MSCPTKWGSRRRRALAFVAGISALTLSAPVAAVAAPMSAAAARPVAADDSYRVYASGEYSLDVLANDDQTFLSSAELTLCAVTVDDATQRVLYAEIDPADPSRIYLETNRNADGLVRFTYDVCQGEQRDTSTVSVDISLLSSPRVTKPRKRGRITATNANEEALQILWGSNRGNVNDGRRVIAPGRRITIKVSRTRIYWVAYLIDQGSVIVAGEGTVAKIKKSR